MGNRSSHQQADELKKSDVFSSDDDEISKARLQSTLAVNQSRFELDAYDAFATSNKAWIKKHMGRKETWFAMNWSRARDTHQGMTLGMQAIVFLVKNHTKVSRVLLDHAYNTVWDTNQRDVRNRSILHHFTSNIQKPGSSLLKLWSVLLKQAGRMDQEDETQSTCWTLLDWSIFNAQHDRLNTWLRVAHQETGWNINDSVTDITKDTLLHYLVKTHHYQLVLAIFKTYVHEIDWFALDAAGRTVRDLLTIGNNKTKQRVSLLEQIDMYTYAWHTYEQPILRTLLSQRIPVVDVVNLIVDLLCDTINKQKHYP